MDKYPRDKIVESLTSFKYVRASNYKGTASNWCELIIEILKRHNGNITLTERELRQKHFGADEPDYNSYDLKVIWEDCVLNEKEFLPSTPEYEVLQILYRLEVLYNNINIAEKPNVALDIIKEICKLRNLYPTLDKIAAQEADKEIEKFLDEFVKLIQINPSVSKEAKNQLYTIASHALKVRELNRQFE